MDPDRHQLLGMRDRKRAQHQRVDEREHRGVRADAERENRQDDQRELLVLSQRPQRVGEVLSQIAHEVAPPHGALQVMIDGQTLVADAGEIAELLECFRPRRLGVESASTSLRVRMAR